MQQLDYRRSDIDGLRAIAVISVFIFHLNSNWLPGGFVGVDIFFILSSYLITSLIISKLELNIFSFNQFYTRRIKRIFPALIFVFVTITLIASQTNAYLLLDAKFIPLLTYNMHVLNYFSADAQKNFFLHYWSLAIEEQFYLMWPLILVLTYKITSYFSEKIFTFTILIICIFVFFGGLIYAINELSDPLSSSAAYFSSIPRFGELAFGAICAIFIRSNPYYSKFYLKIFEFIGLFGLMYSLYFSNEVSFPGYASILPTICTGLILISMTINDSKSLISILLRIQPLPLIGKMSYSIYLWHWPIVSIARFIQGDNNLDGLLIIGSVFLTFFLSLFSYKFIEQPCLHSKLSVKQIYLLYFSFSTLALFLVICFSGLEKYNIRPLIGGAHANITIDGQNAHLSEGWIAPCWEKDLVSNEIKYIENTCGFGAKNGPRILLVGDSHASALGHFFNLIADKENFQITSYQVGACQLTEWGLAARVPAFVKTTDRSKKCNDLLDYVKNNYQSYDAVFIANAFNLFSGDFDVFLNKTTSPPKFNLIPLSEIAKTTPIFIFYDEPVIDRSMQYSPLLHKLGLAIGGKLTYGGNSGNDIIKNAVSDINNIHWVDLSDEYNIFISNDFLYDNKPVYVDTNHLNHHGGKILAHIFLENKKCLLCTIEK